MYLPPLFREDRLDVQHALIRAHPLGLLVTAGPGGLVANPIPFLVDPDDGELGTLRAHFAVANPQRAELAAVRECLVVFQGVESYITPSWYATKAETGKVVPTWNYAIVEAWGPPTLIDDPAWLRQQIGELTDAQEASRPDRWAVEDAPDAYVAGQLKGIVGLTIPIARIAGKWKTSQNRPAADRAGVVAGLRRERGADDPMAALVEARGKAGA